MYYVTIASAGNATDFGDLTITNRCNCSGSGSTKAVFARSNAGSSDAEKSFIDIITVASTGNGADFGDLTYKCTVVTAAAGNATPSQHG